MTTDRYIHPRRALSLIELLEERPGTRESADLLRESAEDLLLARGRLPERDDPLEAAALALTQLIVIDATSRSLAGAIMEALHESGPKKSAGAPQLAASGLSSSPLA